MFYAILFFKLTGTTVVEYVQVSHADVHIIIFFQFVEQAVKGCINSIIPLSISDIRTKAKWSFYIFHCTIRKIRLLSTG